jgi:hypothetical protein
MVYDLFRMLGASPMVNHVVKLSPDATSVLGRRLLAFAELPAVYHHVLLVRGAADSEGPKENLSKCIRASVPLRSGALLRGDGREGGPALLDLVTAAVRAGSLFRVMLCNGQNLRECFLAGVADELIVGHTDLPSPGMAMAGF